MLKSLSLRLKKIFYKIKNIFSLQDKIEDAKILSAKILINQINNNGVLDNIQNAEFKVFSQYGEDGIIQYLIYQTCLKKNVNKFIEFGVENYEESNTRFLLVNNNWEGLVIDGSHENIKQCQSKSYYWRHSLNAIQAFVDVSNINNIIDNSGFAGEIGLLSIDIDGNDYWVWKSIDVVQPVIVVCEYNSLFGADHAVTVPYNPDFVRRRAHFSNLYFGCSLKALEILGKSKGYSLVGSTSVGNNAFFVRHDKCGNLKVMSASETYVESLIRESRDENNQLTFLSGRSRIEAIQNMPVFDVEKNALFLIKDIFSTPKFRC